MLIKNFIDQNTCNHFVQILAKSKYLNYEKDNQITNETTKGYYKALQKFHLSQTERVSEIFKKELIPTNDYSRIYTKGSTLGEHTDDGKCEYSLTVNLLNTPEYERWPFYTET